MKQFILLTLVCGIYCSSGIVNALGNTTQAAPTRHSGLIKPAHPTAPRLSLNTLV